MHLNCLKNVLALLAMIRSVGECNIELEVHLGGSLTNHGDLIIETTVNTEVKVRGGPMHGYSRLRCYKHICEKQPLINETLK